MRVQTLRLHLFVAALVTIAALAAPAVATAAPAAARTSVTLAPYAHGVFGYVSSDDGQCSAGRRVEVLAQSGSGSRADRLVGSARARATQGGAPPAAKDYMWRLRKRPRVRVYARVAPKPGCAGASSKPVKVSTGGPQGAGGAGVPDCPAAGQYCRLDELHFDTGICPSFTAYAGTCAGSILGPANWRTGGGHFDWSFVRGPSFRKVILYGTSYQDYRETEWRLLGYMGGPGAAEWPIEDGFNKRGAYADAHWYTPEAEGKAGSLGGPLHLDFQNGILGADVYVYGYLYRRDG